MAHGGMAVIYGKKIGQIKKIDFPNPDNFEVLPVIGSLKGTSRKIAVIGAYLPPNYTIPRGAAVLDHIENLIVHIKQKFRPFHRTGRRLQSVGWEASVSEFPDIREVLVGPTRADRAIDCLFTNMGLSVLASGTVPPLETDHSVSDHRIAYATFRVQRHESFEWVTYSYRVCFEEVRGDFSCWIVQQHWEEILQAVGSDGKADAFQDIIDAAMNTFFPLRTVRRKSTDPVGTHPWSLPF